MKFPVEQDTETLIEYRDEFGERYQEIEHLVIELEHHIEDINAARQLHSIFQQLLLSSTRLNLAPLVENIAEIEQLMQCIIDQKKYPKAFSEYLLLLIDRLLLMADDALHTSSIDMLKTQNIHVSLQTLVLCNNIDEIEKNIPLAIDQITGSTAGSRNLHDDFDIALFDSEEDELFIDGTHGSPEIISLASNPILTTQEYMQQRQQDSLTFLSDLAETQTHYQYTHTQFLHEIALTMNFMENEPVPTEELWAAICLHDIALMNITDSLSQQRQLTPQQLEQIKEHPIVAAQLSKRMVYGNHCQQTILQHHERIDGRGYPYGLKNGDICDGAKMLAIVDSFHAMITRRPYKKYVKSLPRAISEIDAARDTLYSSRWINVFKTCLKDYWIPSHYDKSL